MPDGDDGDIRLRHRQGLDATSQPRYGVEVGEVIAAAQEERSQGKSRIHDFQEMLFYIA